MRIVSNFASTHQTLKPRGFSEVGENKQLDIAIVGISFIVYEHFHQNKVASQMDNFDFLHLYNYLLLLLRK